MSCIHKYNAHLLLHFYILEYGMYSPGLSKHGSKRRCVTHDEDPRANLSRRHISSAGMTPNKAYWHFALQCNQQTIILFFYFAVYYDKKRLNITCKVICSHSAEFFQGWREWWMGWWLFLVWFINLYDCVWLPSACSLLLGGMWKILV